MIAAWQRWVAFTSRLEDARALRLVRILVPLALLGDLLELVGRGASDATLFPASMGGVAGDSANWAVLAGQPWGGPLLWALCVVSLPLVSLGIATRPAIGVALLADSQLGHLFVAEDRGIDRILRTVLVLLLFSPVSERIQRPRIEAWASDLLRWLLVLVYLDAGVSKLLLLDRWLDPQQPELYTILADPMAGRLDPVAWAGHPWPFVVGGAATLVVELGSPLILTRWSREWALLAACIHVGIAATMDLGMFPFGMLALYPVIARPFEPCRPGSS